MARIVYSLFGPKFTLKTTCQISMSYHVHLPLNEKCEEHNCYKIANSCSILLFLFQNFHLNGSNFKNSKILPFSANPLRRFPHYLSLLLSEWKRKWFLGYSQEILTREWSILGNLHCVSDYVIKLVIQTMSIRQAASSEEVNFYRMAAK